MVKIKEEFKNRLDKALEYNNMKPVDLARLTNLSESTISQYRSGYSKPKDKRLVEIANALHVDPTWLMGVDVPMQSSSTPVFAAAAGEGLVSDGSPIGEIALHLEADQVVSKVVGKSMEPELKDGDYVVIQAQSIPDYPRQICLVQINGDEPTLKRVEIKDSGLLLIGDNPSVYTPHYYTPDEVNDLPVRIHGIVIKLIREFE